MKFNLIVSVFAVILVAYSGMSEAHEQHESAINARAGYEHVSDLVPLPEFIPGLGSLYVKPSTLPAGPFLAYDRGDELVSTVYMIPLEELNAQAAFKALAAPGAAVVRTDVQYNAGHPGVEEPHYHIVLWHRDPSSADLD